MRAAFALRKVFRTERRWGPHRELRIGIDSGEAVAGTGEGGQHLVTGSVVNAAARLQTSAAPGEIRVGALTRRLTRDAVIYAERVTIQAKGFGEVGAWPAAELVTALPEHTTASRSPSHSWREPRQAAPPSMPSESNGTARS